MKITISPKAEKQLKKLPKIDQIAIAKKIRFISNTEEVAEVIGLKSYQNIFRIRVGDRRLVYKKTKDSLYVVLIGHRKDIYKLVERLFV